MRTVHPTTAGSSGIHTERLRDIAVEALLDAGFRPGRPTVLLDVPLHRNVGDSLIALGEFQLIGYAARRLHSSLHHIGHRSDGLRATMTRIPPEANVLLQGGGNFGDLWPKSHEYRLKVTSVASPRGRVIWLPQSMWFLDEHGDIANRTQQVLDEHQPAVLIRDHDSVARFTHRFGRDAVLCPDLGMCAEVSPRGIHPGTSLDLIRRDEESISGTTAQPGVDWTDVPKASALRSLANRLAWQVVRRSPDSVVRQPRGVESTAFRTLGQSLVRSGLELLGDAETIHTDRLHAAVLALLSGGNARVQDNVYGKVSSVLRTWSDFVDRDRISFVDSTRSRPDAGSHE